MEKRYFPMFIDLSGSQILVVGGGRIAARRIRTLLLFSPRKIRVAASSVCEELLRAAEEYQIDIERRTYGRDLLTDMDLVLAATDDPKCNEQVAEDCRKRGIPVNVCHRKELCDFYFPGIAIEDHLVAGVTAGGMNHRMAKKARERIAEVLKELKQEEDYESEDKSGKQRE